MDGCWKKSIDGWISIYRLLLLLLLRLLPGAGTTATSSDDVVGSQEEKAGPRRWLPGGGRGGSYPAQMLASGIHYVGRGMLGGLTYFKGARGACSYTCKWHAVGVACIPSRVAVAGWVSRTGRVLERPRLPNLVFVID
jgi:hypothetical protein